ncbi:hypothetical protein BC835DRAFT_758648 [Cytidiella melzeri]|nr:hypothetical protein BC835DRAFT_758648 [Cytidiella melzeri]
MKTTLYLPPAEVCRIYKQLRQILTRGPIRVSSQQTNAHPPAEAESGNLAIWGSVVVLATMYRASRRRLSGIPPRSNAEHRKKAPIGFRDNVVNSHTSVQRLRERTKPSAVPWLSREQRCAIHTQEALAVRMTFQKTFHILQSLTFDSVPDPPRLVDMTSLENKDSKSTLVEIEEVERNRDDKPHPLSASPMTPGSPSPFSASFDPNTATPLTPPLDVLSPMTSIARHQPVRATSYAWTSSISTSLNTLASQFSAASQTLAALPISDDATPEIVAVVQQAQTKLEQELESLKEQVTYLLEHGRHSDKEKGRAADPSDIEGYESRLQGIEQKLEQFSEVMKLDQARLYGRLQNSVVTSNKMRLTPLIMANGKIPQNFPATKGEFEHLTKERYEHLLKSYGLPIKGDTAAKRQSLREFIGLTPAA